MSRRNKQKKKTGDDDEVPIRQVVREFVEGKWITVIMSIVTLFALFGDDFRLWFFDKQADPYFFVGLIISLILFTMEILVNSCVLDDFKYSFFFWLDIVATLSIFADVEWIVTLGERLLGMDTTIESADVQAGEFAKEYNS